MDECGYVRACVLVWKAVRGSTGLLWGNWFLWEMSGLGECDMSHRAERFLWPLGSEKSDSPLLNDVRSTQDLGVEIKWNITHVPSKPLLAKIYFFGNKERK